LVTRIDVDHDGHDEVRAAGRGAARVSEPGCSASKSVDQHRHVIDVLASKPRNAGAARLWPGADDLEGDPDRRGHDAASVYPLV
jgi:hypothetical protein